MRPSSYFCENFGDKNIATWIIEVKGTESIIMFNKITSNVHQKSWADNVKVRAKLQCVG